MKIILGGGLIGLLARDILGPSWTILPQGKSRFFSLSPPIGSNFIVYHKKVANYLDEIDKSVNYLKVATSYDGALFKEIPNFLKQELIDKLFLGKPHPITNLEIPSGNMILATTAKQLYDRLVIKYNDELVNNTNKYGKLNEISNNKIITDKTTLDFDRIISTIPLKALFSALNINFNYDLVDSYYYDITTDNLDLEGYNLVYVADSTLPFYKAIVLQKNLYQICSYDELNPNFFAALCKNRFEIKRAIVIRDSIPLGAPANLSNFNNITCVGSLAQHDYFMDVSSSIRALLNLVV